MAPLNLELLQKPIRSWKCKWHGGLVQSGPVRSGPVQVLVRPGPNLWHWMRSVPNFEIILMSIWATLLLYSMILGSCPHILWFWGSGLHGVILCPNATNFCIRVCMHMHVCACTCMYVHVCAITCYIGHMCIWGHHHTKFRMGGTHGETIANKYFAACSNACKCKFMRASASAYRSSTQCTLISSKVRLWAMGFYLEIFGLEKSHDACISVPVFSCEISMEIFGGKIFFLEGGWGGSPTSSSRYCPGLQEKLTCVRSN